MIFSENAMNSDSQYRPYFLGPKSENQAWVRAELQSILGHWFRWRKDLFPNDVAVISDSERTSSSYLVAREKMAQGLEELNELLEAEVPKFTPRYIGHMVSELALPALMGHFAMLLHNPNNTSRDASKVGSRIEVEVVAMLAEMLGFDPEKATGHITGGGTVANFEAVWRARFRQDHWLSLVLYLAEERGVKLDLFEGAHMGWNRFAELLEEYNVPVDDLRAYSAIAANPYEFGERMSKAFDIRYRGPVMLIPENKHFSWSKATNIFGFGEQAFWPIPLDAMGKTDIAVLQGLIKKARQENRPITMVVSVAGTTETGEIDPIDQTQGLINCAQSRDGIDLWHHIDAAYGGFLCSMLHGDKPNVLSVGNTAALAAIGQAHSVTIDPHKLGYVPYACGAIIVKDPQAYAVSGFKAPYLDRQQDVPDKWSTTLEGSRSAAGAAATWLTGKTLGFDGGGIGRVIADTIEVARSFKAEIEQTLPFVQFLSPSETNIVCFSLSKPDWTLSKSNRATEAVFKRFENCPDFSVSKTTLSGNAHAKMIKRHVSAYGGICDVENLVLLRCVFMNPFWQDPNVGPKLTREIATYLTKWFEELSA
jgi:glutamate/tyrosine decarboxylase-like PLP-dependent enzyme